MTAVHDTLHTAELLEMILINVDMHTLLLAQRVSRYWSESIEGSMKLQKKLFLIPATSGDIIKLNIASNISQNSMVESMVVDSNLKAPTPSDVSVLNPLFDWERTRFFATPSIPICTRPDRDNRDLSRHQVTPSWHKMVMTQPPQFELWTGQKRCNNEKLIAGNTPAGRPHFFRNVTEVGIMAPTRVYEQWGKEGQRGVLSWASVHSSAIFWEMVDKERALASSRQGEGDGGVES
ncbi:hypothetical protein CLAFUW4_11691 [Fulvia fulva]|uniref:uncharacterized protein n=1 Tax=Passalora fulva TaxID=5499 RepID=UPI00285275FF|nr:uncharacterized protein CLAFUR5_20319 [Fulvia fulva]KAK4619531.1 hypothetical protein CLAFUR4_11696 [Fulvia fulva]KAK4620242.1 hypothetical protein CLAFUR0_11708 [Fulvia fulva]WMI38967.1 hypothetical protein CLAFUR5_20319 [Fulvia fulva]WPV17686.1 hypothetical protein CLAFUW4_11691 [Fulvia fulva]WPV32271.1 hypothetical protein CLAFUW7_11698 [Fulvia fulva]